MRDYSTLTDAEINAKLAEKMGWTHQDNLLNQIVWFTGNNIRLGFSPCTSRDDLAVVVEWIEENNREVTPALHAALLIHDARGFQYSTLWLLTCPPRIIAEACLEVLEG